MTDSSWQMALLSAGELYEVGGSIRDRFLRDSGVEVSPTSDCDLVVRGIPVDEFEALLAPHGKLSLVGKSFGVFKFTPRGEKRAVDIVYPRTERSTGVSHTDFEVRYDWRLPIEEDLVRRDFTINAIARNIATGDIVDPCGGREDIQRRVLKTIFDDAFVEDPLRILRGVRFAARFGLTIEKGTFERMSLAGGMLDSLSPERIQEELSRLLTEAPCPSGAFLSLREMGALRVFLPELDRCSGVEQNEFHRHDVFDHSLATCDAAPRDDLVVRWAALMHDTGKVDCKQEVEEDGVRRIVFYGHEHESARLTREVLQRLRYAVSFVDRCEHIVENHMFNYLPEWKDATVRRFIRKVGKENLEALFALREADCRSREPRGNGIDDEAFIDNLRELERRVSSELAAENAIHLSDLCVSGGDVMRELGIREGPEVGRVLEFLLCKVTDEPTLNNRPALLEIMRKYNEG